MRSFLKLSEAISTGSAPANAATIYPRINGRYFTESRQIWAWLAGAMLLFTCMSTSLHAAPHFLPFNSTFSTPMQYRIKIYKIRFTFLNDDMYEYRIRCGSMNISPSHSFELKRAFQNWMRQVPVTIQYEELKSIDIFFKRVVQIKAHAMLPDGRRVRTDRNSLALSNFLGAQRLCLAACDDEPAELQNCMIPLSPAVSTHLESLAIYEADEEEGLYFHIPLSVQGMPWQVELTMNASDCAEFGDLNGRAPYLILPHCPSITVRVEYSDQKCLSPTDGDQISPTEEESDEFERGFNESGSLQA